MVSIRKLKHFQDLGHQVVFLIGDFTGMVGDPTGRNEMRRIMTMEEVEQNAKTYKQQVFKVLDSQKTQVRFNSEWLGKLSIYDFMGLSSKQTVARMLERDDFQKRYTAGQDISILEFLYCLLQGYDSVALKADVELGGTDQKFNLLTGRTIQKRYGMETQVAITLPLLVGTDGKEKMSKSLGNYIGINESPKEIYGKILSISDNLIYSYFLLTTDISKVELANIQKELQNPEKNPMDLKRRLAREIITMYHSSDAARAAEDEFNKIFQRKEIPSEVEEFQVTNKDKMWIIQLLTESGTCSSSSEARRMVQQGAVYLDSKRINDVNEEITIDNEMILKVGKRKFLKIVKTN